ncbi:glutathione S-transferase family protein [Maritalea sp.]|uniref:glutathione S-transferase family protein n=1 Tax=Maritalea sp. TaxID=2003361 RepID=UPI003EF24AF7
MTIQFFQPPTEPGKPNLSPFCTKLDMILQLSGVEFDRQLQMSPMEGPKQKAPFIEDGGERIGDTQFIEMHLKTAYNIDLLNEMSPMDRAVGRMLMSTMEEQLYFILVYSRWQIEENWPIMEEIFFGNMPEQVRKEIAPQALTMMRTSLFGQGTGRHTAEEVYQLAKRIIDDTSTLLGSSDYFMSNKPTSIDASIYGVLSNCVNNPVPAPLADYVRSHPNLLAFLDRISTLFFPNADKAQLQAA